MSILIVFLYALVVVVALLLIGVILIQPSKSGGMGAAFGGIGESVFGGKTGSHLTKATVWMTAIFLILTLGLAALVGHGFRLDNSESGVQKVLKGKTAKAEAKAPAKVEAKKSVPVKKAPATKQVATKKAPAAKTAPAKK
jgi:preprotein translocase subunit SecG